MLTVNTYMLTFNVYTVNTGLESMTANKQNYHHGDVPRALMDAALVRIKNDGVEKLSLRAIARDIGVSQSAPYRHFKDKTELLVKLACEGFEKLADIDAIDISDDNVLNNLVTIGCCYIKFARENPETYKLMFGSKIEDRNSHEALHEAGQKAFSVIVNEVTKGVETGYLLDQEPLTLARCCWSKVHGLACLAIDGFFNNIEVSISDFLAQQVTFCVRGIAKKPEEIAF